MPKLAKPVQGAIVVILAVIVGFGLLQVINNNEDEGFIGTSKSATTDAPIGTAEPHNIPDAQTTPEPSDGEDTPAEPADTATSGSQVTVEYKAPLGADANLLFQGFMFLGLLFGASFAVRKDYTSHRNVMTFLIIVNWFSILGRMTNTFDDVDSLDINQNLAYVHAGLGGLVMLFASYLAVRMWFEKQLPGWVKINPIKVWMRLTLVTWLTLIVLGLLVYLGIYG
jgi:uncharacterized membrane protein YozB (DUF420 family)